MSAGSYDYVNAKVGALRSKMLTLSEYRSLIEVASTEDMLSLLKSTTYGRRIARLKEPDIEEVERALKEYQKEEHQRITHGITGASKGLLERYFSKFEADTLKEALTLKEQGESKESFENLHPTGKITSDLLGRIAEAKDLREAVEVLKDTEFYKPLNQAWGRYQEEGLILHLLMALDRHVYQRLWSSATTLSGMDRDRATDLIGAEIDVKNIVAVLRLRGYEGDLKELLIPVRYRASDTILEALNRLRSLKQFSSEVPHFTYWEIIERAIRNRETMMNELPLMEGKEESFLPIQHELEKFLVKKSSRMFYGNRLHVGIAIAHIYLKGVEIRNIVSALKLKEGRVDNEKIENFILLPS